MSITAGLRRYAEVNDEKGGLNYGKNTTEHDGIQDARIHRRDIDSELLQKFHEHVNH